MSETHDPMNLTAAELRAEYSKALAMVHELATARAAEATQHRQDRRRWAESLKEQHQRHVIESDALRKVLAAWEITANERSARLAAVEAERDRLKAALSQAAQDLETVGNDYPGSSCWQWCAERASVARAALSGEGTAKP